MRRRSKLLIVDGDSGRAERLVRRLTGNEIEVQFATDGAQALLKLQADLPDAVLLAAELPILNGFLTLQALRSEPRTARLPVILLMGEGMPEDIARGWRAGADLCVPIGQSEADLVATLHRALDDLFSAVPHAAPINPVPIPSGI